MIIKVPEWCRIGWTIEWNHPEETGMDWVQETIVAYGYDGFFHQAHNCPLYYTEFSEYGKTVRLSKACEEVYMKSISG